MTKEELAAIVAATTQSVISALTDSGIIGGVKKSPEKAVKRTKSDNTSEAIGKILSDAPVGKGRKRISPPAGQAIIMEYSEKQYALWGDTKAYKETIKKYGALRYGIIWGFTPDGATEENQAEGWYISRSQLEKNGGKKVLIKALKEEGLKIVEGESLREKTEAHRAAAKPKKKTGTAKKETKVVPMPTPSFSGAGHTPKGVIHGDFIQFVKNEDLYIHTDEKGKASAYICIGEDSDGKTQFMLVTTKVNGAEIDNYERIAKIAALGLPCAYSEGVVDKIAKWQLDAYKVSDKDAYDWLVKNAKAA